MVHQALQDLNEECAALFFHDLGRLPTADRGRGEKEIFQSDLQNGFESRMISILRRLNSDESSLKT